MKKLILTAAVFAALPVFAQDVQVGVPGGGVPGAQPPGPRLTIDDVVPTGQAHEAFEWQPRPVTRFDLTRRKRVEKLSVGEALAAFYAQCNQVGLQEKWPDLSAYFEVQPTALKVAYEALHTGTMPSNAIVPFYIAVGKARVPEARDLLLMIVGDEADTPMDRTRAMFALVDREDTGPALSEKLAKMAQVQATTHHEKFLKGEAMLALSMQAGIKRKDAAIHAVSENAVRALLATGDHGDERIAMKAIGNMADASLLPLALPVTRSADPYVRMEAAYAFRRLNPVHSEELVLGWLATEKHPFVKAKIYQIVQLQHFDLHTQASAALTRQAIQDMPKFTSGVDRRTVVRLLGASSVKNQPWVREALVAQAKFEHQKNTGYLNEFSEILTPAEMWKVIR